MILTYSDIKYVFHKLLDGTFSREDADRWAFEKMSAYDSGSLKFEPKGDEQFLWSAIMYLYGIDTMIAPGKYMHSLDDIRETFEKKWSRL